MAPELTRTTSSPRARAAASASTSASRRSPSRPPVVVVSDDEPTLTTMRLMTRRPPRLLAGRAGLGLERALGDELLATLLVGAPVVVVQALVLAAAAEHLGAGLDLRVEVEDDRVVVIADDDVVAGRGAHLEQPGLDAEPVEPVGEEPDGLVVAEVGLAHPPRGLLAADDVLPVALDDRELRHRRRTRRADEARCGSPRAAAWRRARPPRSRPSRRTARAGRRGSRRRRRRRRARAPRGRRGRSSAISRGVGHVDLVEGDEARPVVETAVGGQLAPR